MRTMFERVKSVQVATEMRNYNVTIGRGEKRLTTGALLLFSGHEVEGAPHTMGVPFNAIKGNSKSTHAMGGIVPLFGPRNHQSLLAFANEWLSSRVDISLS